MASRNVLLIFKANVMYKPVIYRLARDFDLIFNILEAKILPRKAGKNPSGTSRRGRSYRSGREFSKRPSCGSGEPVGSDLA